jgi:serine protease
MDLVNSDVEPNDDNGHGTHVTNTISQNTNNGVLGAGVANGARIMPIKVLNGEGSGEELALATAIHLAADNGAQVINMSLGFPAGTQASELPLMAEAVTYAYNKGVTIVAAAGNDGTASCSYPAAFPEVICVGATKYDGNPAWYSNYGTDIDLVAPGGSYCAGADDFLCLLLGYPYFYNDQSGDGWPDGILQETFGSDYTFDDWFYEGTSMATPHVAAVAAIVIGKARHMGLSLTPQEVRSILNSTAKDKGEPGYDSTYGWGLVDAYNAINAVSEAPLFTLTVTSNGNGTIHSSGTNDINCRAGSCTMSYLAGTVVTLTPEADSENTFGCWSACEASSCPSCYVTMDADKSITGSFLDYCQMFLLQRYGIQPTY